MLKKPSSRRKTKNEGFELNLVPMLDALVTMIAFLLYSMSFLALVSIDSPAPIAATRQLENKLKEKPLQLTVSVSDSQMRIWSPFNKIKGVTIRNNAEGKPDLLRLHENLVQIKQKFPWENQVVLAPFAGATYDTLIAIMDSLRSLEQTDPPIYAKDKESGLDVQVKKLFPEIVFGNLLGE
ncbi:MAG: hypothetical protein CL678_07220 [Bdellovibrionaceae bacterium]|nr:hypothetical protein [Pseudobdellovibrionaceae bacterium]|tara:strand:+ start:1893 stop:2435 length:543 start_codon:yes stop_codon:yes gene_type:complete